jgi:hypothetical protein
VEKAANLFETNATNLQCSGVIQSKDTLFHGGKDSKNARADVLHRTFVDITVETWKPDYNDHWIRVELTEKPA